MKIYTEEEKQTSDEIKSWLESHSLISVGGLEKICNIPPTTLHNAINGNRRIPPIYFASIIQHLSNYGFEIKSNPISG